MKKIIFSLLFTFISLNIFAQNISSDMHIKSEDNRTWISEKYKNVMKYPVTVSAYGFLNYSALALGSIGGYTYGIDDHWGGGFSITGKVSFSSWLAVALDLSYSAATYNNSSVKSDFGTFLFSPTVVFQRETKRGRAGIVPWAGIGFSISNNSWNVKENYLGNTYSSSASAGGFGFIINAGIKYNMENNAFVGFRTDYSASTFSGTTMNNWRMGIEAGYRF